MSLFLSAVALTVALYAIAAANRPKVRAKEIEIEDSRFGRRVFIDAQGLKIQSADSELFLTVDADDRAKIVAMAPGDSMAIFGAHASGAQLGLFSADRTTVVTDGGLLADGEPSKSAETV